MTDNVLIAGFMDLFAMEEISMSHSIHAYYIIDVERLHRSRGIHETTF